MARKSGVAEVVAVVERKSVEDLVSTIVGGKLWTLLASMAGVSHAAVVVDAATTCVTT